MGELLKVEVYYKLREAYVMFERRRRIYNPVKPHSALRYRLSAPEGKLPKDQSATIHEQLTRINALVNFTKLRKQTIS